MPVVERDEVLDNGSKSRDLVFGVVVHYLHGQLRPVSVGAVQTKLLLHKALQIGNIQPGCNEVVIRRKRAVKLEIVTIHSMVWVISYRVIILCFTAHNAFKEIGRVVGIANGNQALNGVVETAECLATE